MRICLPLLMMLFIAGCAALTGKPGDNWYKADTEVFTLYLPKGLEKSALHGPGNGSFVDQFTNQNMTVTMNEGAYAGGSLDSLSRYKNYTTQTVLVRGLPVQVVTFDIPSGGEHRFDYAIAASYLKIGLTIYVHCRTKEDYQTAIKIFKTAKLRQYQTLR